MADEKRGKCPRCCPDGGAIFTLVHDEVLYWKCNNCGLALKKRKYKATKQPTKSQKYWINKLKGFGGEIEIKMIGRNVWISGKNYEGRKWYDGQSFYGTIGSHGKLNLVLQGFLGNVTITDEIGVKVYLLKDKDRGAPQVC